MRSWAYALRTTNPAPDGPIDTVTRWIVVTRAAVLPMTLFAGLVAALLAMGQPGRDWRWLALAIVGITLAHVANNLMNDLWDTKVGTEHATSPRALYAPHPTLSGLVSKRTLISAILVVNLGDLVILIVLALALPRLVKVWPHFRRPPPDQPPPGFPVWPLWYAALAFVHVRQAGALLVLGLAIGAVLQAM